MSHNYCSITHNYCAVQLLGSSVDLHCKVISILCTILWHCVHTSFPIPFQLVVLASVNDL